MIGLLFIGFVEGLIAGISPCILPVLPVVFVAWSSPIPEEKSAARARRRRALFVVAGLIVSFSAITLVGSTILSALGLPQDLLRNVGIAVLLIVGLSLLVPRLAHVIERPFSRMALRVPSGTGSGFVLGLGLGAVFVPCAGPILTAITVLGTTKHVSLFSVFLTIFFAAGATIPLLAVALAGERTIERNQRLKQRARALRPLGGAVLVLMAIAITFNVADDLQKWLPGYTQTLQSHVEPHSYVKNAIRSLEGNTGPLGKLASCQAGEAVLQKCGKAPNFVGITAWLNTPNDKPLTITGLRGHVVLVDFWTYSCINCQRSLPHVEAWYARYHRDGFDVVGVHSPEFAFEHVVSNVKTAAQQLGVHYPIAIDDNLATWTAYNNEYWPADYLIDSSGVIRYLDFGEGGYTQTENLIRQLLKTANPHVILPSPTNVANKTPTGELSPETYVGYQREEYLDGQTPVNDAVASYRLATNIPLGEFSLGGSWIVHSQEATAYENAKLSINFLASNVYLVMGGNGTVQETLNGKKQRTISVSGIPRLYTLVSLPQEGSGLLSLSFSEGVQAYDFTFG